jgi:nucleotide-binding universal stress UspA family protein
MKPIVVGYDGSADAQSAQCWALDEGVRHSAPVRLVHIIDPAAHRAARDRLEDLMRRRAADAYDWGALGIDVTGAVAEGTAADVLCQQSIDAHRLVVGARGTGGFDGLRLGSVSLAALTHARCPTVVVRPGICTTSRRPVAVGVDESPAGRRAVGVAFEEAATREVDLLVVRAWTPTPADDDDAALQRAEHELVLADVLKEWRDRYPAVSVTERLLPAQPAHALMITSRQAQLMVVGARGQGGFPGLPLGSVAHQVIHHALCTVMVVR